jgi:O-antigen ligase
MIAGNLEDVAQPSARRSIANQRVRSMWTEAYALLALIPVLFISVSGRIQTDYGPVAFRFTAMEEDSFSRRAARLACSLLMVGLIATRSQGVLRVCRRAGLFLLLPLLGFVSVLWSQNSSHTLIDVANLLLTTLFAVYLHVRYPGRHLISFIGFSAFVALVLSIFAVVALPNVGIDAFQQDAWRGIFGQRNNCAAVCVLFLIVGLQWKPRGTMESGMRSVVVLLSLVFIVMSGSRTGWLLTGFGLLITFVLHLSVRMKSTDRLVLLLSVAGLSVAAIVVAASNFTPILALLDKDPTMTQRTVIWAEVLPSIAKHPFLGYGYSAFWNGLSGESMQTVLTTGWMEGQAQDGYLDVLLQLGLIGLLPLCYLFGRGLVQAAGAVIGGRPAQMTLLAMILLPLILIENIGESSFLLPLSIPWFYALIVLIRLDAPQEREEVANCLSYPY